MRIFVTGGSGVLGRQLIPLLRAEGHEVVAPAHADVDLFDPAAVAEAVRGADAVYHLATRIAREPGAWEENNRLRSEASRILVDAALATATQVYIQPTVTFVYPAEGPADETTDLGEVSPRLQSCIDAECEAQRFTEAGRTGIALRLGLLWGPGTGQDAPSERYGAPLNVEDAGAALLAALRAPAGLYNVVADGSRISNAKFKAATGWRPLR